MNQKRLDMHLRYRVASILLLLLDTPVEIELLIHTQPSGTHSTPKYHVKDEEVHILVEL